MMTGEGGGSAMTTVNGRVVFQPRVSESRIVNATEAGVVGVPMMAPEEALRERPAGTLPAETDQPYGGIPSLPSRRPEYGTPAVPFGRVVVRMAGGGMPGRIRSRKARSEVLVLESVALAVKVVLPLAVGMPEIRPAAPLSERPAGRLPALTD